MSSIGLLNKHLCHHNILASLLTLSTFRLVGNMASFQTDKDRYLSMSLEEKRKQYVCGDNYITLNMVPLWKSSIATDQVDHKFKPRPELNKIISIFSGDITKLEIDGIVNAANSKLAGGGGVDGFIHRAAGHDLLQKECQSLGGCPTGKCKVTGGYRLPAKYILHCVGPIGEKPDLLSSCYEDALFQASSHGLRSIAFPCISTGVYGYPQRNAAKVVLKTVRLYLENESTNFDRIIFCTFQKEDYQIYQELLPHYFPE